jgi:Fe-S cluster biogenesis protein NfuA
MHFDRKEFQRRTQKIERLLNTVESASDPHLRAVAVELMQSMMELHSAGLERMLEIAYEAGVPGNEIIERFAEDELTAGLLLLYDLHPLTIDTRIANALKKVRPFLQSQGGSVELLDVTEGSVRLRLAGSCRSCPSSTETLKLAIEKAIYEAAPDVIDIIAESSESAPASGLVQLTGLPGDQDSVQCLSLDQAVPQTITKGGIHA